VVEQAPVAELFARPRHWYTRGLLGAIPRPGGGRLTEIPGMVPAPYAEPAGCPFLPRCGHAEADCAAARPPLDRLDAGHLAACFHPGEGD